MQDNQEPRDRDDVVEDLVSLLAAHQGLRREHLLLAARYNEDTLATFRDGVQVPNDQAAAEHETQAKISEEIIREIEAALFGEQKRIS